MGHKLKFVLSDLHLGAGHVAERGNLLEDFAATTEFTAFLRMVGQESERDQRDVELIINGDFFEFLQVPAVDEYDPTRAYPKEAYLDASQEASIKRLKLIVQGHEEIFNALSDFMHVEVPQRRITLIKGNHDVNLYWPGVKSCLREVLGATGARASLLRFADEFVSREKIYVEHGHQRAEKINGYHDSFDPTSPLDPSQLHYPLGSRFIIDFLNDVEPDRWFVDHIKPLTTLIWYALSCDFGFASQAIINFIRHTPGLNQPNLNTSLLSSGETFLQDLENEQTRLTLAQRYAENELFRRQFHRRIQAYIDWANFDHRRAPTPTLEISEDPWQMGQRTQHWQRSLLRQAAGVISYQEGAKVILFGHTHFPSQEVLGNGSVYINTGSWVNDFSEAPVETWQALFAGTYEHRAQPTLLPYARIDYDEHDNPTARLLYFNHQPETNSQVPPIDLAVSPAGQEVQVKRRFGGRFDRLVRLLGTSSNL